MQNTNKVINLIASRSASYGLVFMIALIVFAGSVTAQMSDRGGVVVEPDTAINPHDFNDKYYRSTGVHPEQIVGRPTGSDGRSVFSFSSDPTHSRVRILETRPAYDRGGDILYWFELGRLTDSGFTDDKTGVEARETAKLFPLYIFPDIAAKSSRIDWRQAPLIDNSWTINTGDINPLGLRQIMIVNYTAKAFTKDGSAVMEYFAKKNGMSANDTPLIVSTEDVKNLLGHELITVEPLRTQNGDRGSLIYSIAPAIKNLAKGAIAPDAYLLTATKNGTTLPSEEKFASNFECLKKTGQFCE